MQYLGLLGTIGGFRASAVLTRRTILLRYILTRSSRTVKTDASVPPQAKSNNPAAHPPPQHAAAVPLTRAHVVVHPSKVSEGVTNTQLLLWMFGFLKPVKPLVFLACLYLSLWVGAEVMAVRQSGQAVNVIGDLRANPDARAIGMWRWLFSADVGAIRLRLAIT
jgi:hypothetical protein